MLKLPDNSLDLDDKGLENRFFSQINKLQKQSGIKIYITDADNKNKEDTSYFSQNVIQKISQIVTKFKHVNDSSGKKIVKELSFSFSKNPIYIAYAEPWEGRLTFGLLFYNSYNKLNFNIISLHELMHIISDIMDLESYGDSLTENTIFKIKYFFPEFGDRVEEFYNQNVNNTTSLRDYAFTFEPDGGSRELLSCIIEELSELFKSELIRDEVKVTRVLKLIALIRFYFGETELSDINSLKKLAGIENDLQILPKDLDKIKEYKVLISSLKSDIRSKTTVEDGAKLPDGFSGRFFHKNQNSKEFKSKFVFIGNLLLLSTMSLSGIITIVTFKNKLKKYVKDLELMNDMNFSSSYLSNLRDAASLYLKGKMELEDFQNHISVLLESLK